MRILTLSTVFPNVRQPAFGVFVAERMRRVARHCDVSVVAPVPWFPGNGWIRPHWAGVPATEGEEGFRVYHPRVLCVPRYAKWTDGDALRGLAAAVPGPAPPPLPLRPHRRALRVSGWAGRRAARGRVPRAGGDHASGEHRPAAPLSPAPPPDPLGPAPGGAGARGEPVAQGRRRGAGHPRRAHPRHPQRGGRRRVRPARSRRRAARPRASRQGDHPPLGGRAQRGQGPSPRRRAAPRAGATLPRSALRDPGRRAAGRLFPAR